MNKKGQGMHMWGATDIFIILIGVIIGMILMAYMVNHGIMSASTIPV